MQLLAAVTLQVPTHHVASLRDLVAEHPTLKLMVRGWIIRDVVIYGPHADVAALSALLPAWEKGERDQDLW